jgi:sulfocyanin
LSSGCNSRLGAAPADQAAPHSPRRSAIVQATCAVLGSGSEALKVRSRLFCVIAVVGQIAAATAGAADKIKPSWMTIDAADKSVAMEIIAGWDPDNGALNYNGFFEGQLTVVVPVGWKVSIHFVNHDGDLPHSLLITRPYPKGSFPDVAGQDQVAIPRAYSRSPDTGIDANQDDQIDFTVKEPGQYYMFCGAQGHAHGGMWNKFEVSAEASEPYVIIADGAPAGYR